MLERLAHIEGLRALAILPILFFHADYSLFSGGFIGVDVFLVISGFLITRIILNDIEKGDFSLSRFYYRRINRIAPALLIMLLFCIPAAWLILPAYDFNLFNRSLSYVPFFISNHYFISEAGYFETASELKPLLHTWSLAVEEQFYIVFHYLLLYFGGIAGRTMPF